MADVLDHADDISADDDWYARWFDEWYPVVYRHRDDASAGREVAAILRLIQPPATVRVLDIACGAGRHTSALRTAGLDAWGVDLSQPLLRLAAARPGLAGRLVRADIRALPFESAFDLAVNLFTSFGYFADEAHNVAALRQMARTLRPAGRLLMDLAHAPAVQATLAPHTRRTVDGFVIESRRRFFHGRVINRMTVVSPRGEVRHLTENVRVYSAPEMQEMMLAAGLCDIRCWGSLEGAPLEALSPRLIITGRHA